MRWSQRTGEPGAAAPSPVMPGETFTRVFVTIDSAAVILLAFAFGFGNGWQTARLLGINPWIAPLIQPAVDLAVVGLMVGIRYLAIHGWSDQQLAKPRRWLRIFGTMTLAMNTALPLHEQHWGRAAWDAVGPILLIAWSELAPWLLRAIYSVRQELRQAQDREAATKPDTALAAVPEPAKAAKAAPKVAKKSAAKPTKKAAARPKTRKTARASRPVVSIKEAPTRAAVRDFLVKWKAMGLTLEDRPALACHGVIDRDWRAMGLPKSVSRERIGQLCRSEWENVDKPTELETRFETVL